MMRKRQAYPYLFSWYLDICYPQWSALVEGAYENGIPLFVKNTILGKSLEHPWFVESLGVGATAKGEDLEVEFLKWQSSIPHVQSMWQPIRAHDALQAMKRYQSWEKSSQKNYPGKVLRRNLRKAEAAGFKTIEEVPADIFIQLLSDQLRFKNAGYTQKQFLILSNLVKAALAANKGRIEGIRDEEGWHCAQFYVYENERCLLVSCFSDEKSRMHSGLHFLLYSIFEKFPDSMQVHFGGSNVRAIAEFNKNFGAVDHYYQVLQRSFLPSPFSRILAWL